MSRLWVIMPAYNEEEAIRSVVTSWAECLRTVESDHMLCVLNDGSKDGTLSRLQSLEKEIPTLSIVDKPNTGHGPTCIAGYELALSKGAEWVFQIDSDGQCDPRYFAELWAGRKDHPLLYGFRAKREDGVSRLLISRLISVLVFLCSGVWVRDSNVPYRLMRADALRKSLQHIPAHFSLSNILLSVFQQSQTGIFWMPIVFRKRSGGASSMNLRNFGKHACILGKQLFVLRPLLSKKA